MALYCPNCGTENNDAAKHCTNCGVAFVQGAAPAAQPVAAPSNGTNTWALVGFIVSLVSNILCCGALNLPAIVFCILGMVFSKKNNEGGWGLALAGLIICGVVTILSVLLYFLGAFAEIMSY